MMRDMQSLPPPLLPILRTETQAELLSALMIRGFDGSSVTQLAEILGTSPSTILREVDRLEAAGITRSERVGRTRLIWMDTESPYARPLRELIEAAFGPQPLIAAALATVEGIDDAIIFGSWARAAHGLGTVTANDIDVLIVGDPDRGQVYGLMESVGDRIGREIDVTFRTNERWHDEADPFIRTVKSRPLIELDLVEREYRNDG